MNKMNRFAVAALSSLMIAGLAAPSAFARDDDRRGHDRYGYQQGRDHDREDRGRQSRNYDHRRDDRRGQGRNYDRRDHDRYNYGRAHYSRDHGRYNYGRTQYSRGDYRYDYRRAPVVVHRPVAVPYGWARGQRYNAHYRGPVYVVNDYRHYRLHPPPYGHRWIRDDRGNLLLIAIASGIIADLILHGG